MEPDRDAPDELIFSFFFLWRESVRYKLEGCCAVLFSFAVD